MTDDRFTPAADDELLSAYLLGDTDPAATEDFEARLAAEPDLAAKLDALAAALVVLGAHDDVEEPPGFADRLEERLRAAREPAAVVSLDDARERRARSRGWWTAVGTAAAVVAVGAVMGANVLRNAGMVGGGGLAAGGGDEAVTMDMAESDGEMQLEESAGGGGAGASSGRAADSGAAPEAAAAAPAPTTPQLYDEQTRVRGEKALAGRYADAPEVVTLLGMPVDQAAAVAAEYAAVVREAPPFASGSAPGDCLDTVTPAAEQPLVPVRVETLRYAGEPALAYVLVTAEPDSTELDRVETWVVSPGDCATLLFQQR